MHLSILDLLPVTRLILVVLLHFVWQATLVVGLIAVTRNLIHPRHSRARYLASVIGLLALLMLPVVTCVGGFPGIDVAPAQDLWHSADSHVFVGQVVNSEMPGFTQQLALQFQVVFNWFDQHRFWWLGGWIAGFTLLTLRLSLSLGYCRRLRARCQPLPPAVEELAERLRSKLNLTQDVVIGTSREITQAIATGMMKPIVLIPASWLSQLPIASIEAVLAHELAHVRRWDLWVNFLQRLSETVFFFHPLVWWVSKVISNDREVCCDRLAVKVTGNAMSYVETLAQVAGNSNGESFDFQFGNAFSGGKNMNLLRRAKLILEPAAIDARAPLRLMALAMVLGLLASYGSLAYSAANSSARQDRDQEHDREADRHRDHHTDLEKEYLRRERDAEPRAARNEKRRPQADDRRKDFRNHLTELLHRNEMGTVSEGELANRLRELADRLEPGRTVLSTENVRRTEARNQRNPRWSDRPADPARGEAERRFRRHPTDIEEETRFEPARDNYRKRVRSDAEDLFWRRTLTERKPRPDSSDAYFQRQDAEPTADRMLNPNRKPNWRPAGDDREFGQLLRELRTEIQQLRREVDHLKSDQDSKRRPDVGYTFPGRFGPEDADRPRKRDERLRFRENPGASSFRRREGRTDDVEFKELRYEPRDKQEVLEDGEVEFESRDETDPNLEEVDLTEDISGKPEELELEFEDVPESKPEKRMRKLD